MDAQTCPRHVPADRVIDFNPMGDPALNVDVHKTTAAGAAASPSLAYTTANGGHWVAFGRAEIEQVLSDSAFSTRHMSLDKTARPHKYLPLQLDPPAHAPYRHMLLKHIGPREVRDLEPFVREWCDKLISPLEGKSECDFVADVAEPMPVSVFMELMGLPLDRFHEFRNIMLTAPLTAPEADPDGPPVTRMMTVAAILKELVAARRAEPRDDLISKLIAEQIDGRPVTEDELLNICLLLFVAGLDTVTNAMGFGIKHLATDQALQAKVRADPSLIPEMSEDLLRRYSFVNTVRTVIRDVDLGGVNLREGDQVVCSLWGGSNDGTSEGSAARHLAFGFGPHMCIGMHLARLELKVMYETWFRKIGTFRLAPGKADVVHGGMVMGITSLPLLLEPKTA